MPFAWFIEGRHLGVSNGAPIPKRWTQPEAIHFYCWKCGREWAAIVPTDGKEITHYFRRSVCERCGPGWIHSLDLIPHMPRSVLERELLLVARNPQAYICNDHRRLP